MGIPYASMVQLVLGCQGEGINKDDHDEHVEVPPKMEVPQ